MPVGWVFNHSKLLDPIDQRAYARVSLVNSATCDESFGIDCLVDTGSDWTILPIDLADSIGLKANGPPVQILSANGQVQTFDRITNVEIIIENFSLLTEIAVSSAEGFQGILGRCDAVSTFDIAFNTKRWYFG